MLNFLGFWSEISLSVKEVGRGEGVGRPQMPPFPSRIDTQANMAEKVFGSWKAILDFGKSAVTPLFCWSLICKLYMWSNELKAFSWFRVQF